MDNTISNPYYTFSWDKVSCVVWMWYVHIVLSYVVFLSGIACFATRTAPCLLPWHRWAGRSYVCGMLWLTASALVIHNTGLPPATLVSFLWVLGGCTLGWACICVAAERFEAEALRRLSKGDVGAGVQRALQRHRRELAASRTLAQRVLSLKAVHGALMFASWFNIAGRIFASKQAPGSFTCYTFPFYKNITLEEGEVSLTPVPDHNPNFNALPWAHTGLAGWGAALLLGETPRRVRLK
eukprot:m51a1_g4464 hypothetical protein (239) ;mRNA; f:204652-205845